MTDLEGLTAGQRRQLSARVKTLTEHTDSARLIAERWGTPPGCAHCGSDAVVRLGHSAGQQCFRCKAYGKTFMVLTGTPMQRLREQEKWMAYVECMS